MKPKISIIVPCYYQAQYLDECLQSVLEQSYTNWECIIVNDGSPDNTEEIAEQWIDSDKRFKYLFQQNGGISSARNLGIGNAKGEFVLPLDADDKISNNYLRLALNAFQEDPSLTVVYCSAEKFGEDSGAWILPIYSNVNLAKENIIFSSALYKWEDWKKVGGYDENMGKGLEDWEFWIALIKNGGKVKKIEDVCFFYRIKKKSRNKNLLRNDFKNLENYLSIKHVDFFVKEHGSFPFLSKKIDKLMVENDKRLESKKFVLDLFLKLFSDFLFSKIRK